LAVLISFIFMFVISIWDFLKLPEEWLQWPIYYGTLYGPFVYVYCTVKRQVLCMDGYSLPSWPVTPDRNSKQQVWDRMLFWISAKNNPTRKNNRLERSFLLHHPNHRRKPSVNAWNWSDSHQKFDVFGSDFSLNIGYKDASYHDIPSAV
jgi:hypothetical protein